MPLLIFLSLPSSFLKVLDEVAQVMGGYIKMQNFDPSTITDDQTSIAVINQIKFVTSKLMKMPHPKTPLLMLLITFFASTEWVRMIMCNLDPGVVACMPRAKYMLCGVHDDYGCLRVML